MVGLFWQWVLFLGGLAILFGVSIPTTG